MCMADITIGRKSWFRTNQITGSGSIVGDTKRVALIFSLPTVTATPCSYSIRLGTASSAITLVTVNNAMPTFVMRVEDYGQIVFQPMFASEIEAAGFTLTVTEVLLNDVEETEPEE